MIGARLRLELDRINRDAQMPAQDDAGPSLIFAAICVLLSAAISVGLIVWAVRAIL